MNRAIFRADASAEIGGGHVMRCLTLAGQLADRGWDCSFETNEASLETVTLLTRSLFHAETVEERWGEPCDLLVVDHYGLDRSYETRQRKRTDRILVLDDAPGRQHDCDILLDQSPGREASDYVALTPSNARCLTGTDFALLRPEFTQERKKAKVRKEMRSILVSTGASDPASMMEPVMEAIVSSGIETDITLVATSAMPALETVRAKAQSLGFTVVTNTDDMAAIMRSHDFTIGAAGGMSWERCCVGLPSAVFIVADNQGDNAAMLHKMGAAFSLGKPDATGFDALSRTLREMTSETLAEMSERAFEIVDGQGAKRVLIALAGAKRLDGGEDIILRGAVESDMERVFQWQSIPGIRRHFRNPEPPALNEHRKWFAEVMADQSELFCIIEADLNPCGFVRLSPRSSGGFEVSILVLPEQQGKGVTGAALSLVRVICPGDDLWAQVYPDNVGSGRLFQTQGYASVGDDWYMNAGCSTDAKQTCQ